LSDLSPSERELEILKALWEQGEASVRQVHDRLCPNGELAFNTTQTLLRIMEEKGLVAHRAQGRTFIYRPKYSRERASASFLHKVFDGALDQLVLSMLEAENHTPDELKELERLIARARRRKQSQNNE
jgi:BlaI family penicillinase repressor